MRLTRLSKPITRRIEPGRLVVRITADGVEFKAFRRRSWQRVSWQQIATLASVDDQPVIQAIEHADGLSRLKAIGVIE